MYFSANPAAVNDPVLKRVWARGKETFVSHGVYRKIDRGENQFVGDRNR